MIHWWDGFEIRLMMVETLPGKQTRPEPRLVLFDQAFRVGRNGLNLVYRDLEGWVVRIGLRP